MVDEKNKNNPSMTQIIKDSLGSGDREKDKEKLRKNNERTKAIILLIGFIVILSFFIFPYIIGLGSEFFSSSPNPLINVIGIMLAALVIYMGGFRK